MNIEKIYKSFIDFIKYIYSSNLLKEIYYNIPEFKQFFYPYDNKDILDELFNNTKFMPF